VNFPEPLANQAELMGIVARLQDLSAQFRKHPQTRSRPSAAWARFAWWQLKSRLTGRPMTNPFVNGSKLVVWRGRTSSTAAWYFGLPDFEEMSFALHLLRPGDLFLDGGANVGVWSVLAASTGAKVLAVEPVPDTFALLNRQAEVNDFGARFTARRCALSEGPGTVRMTTGHDAVNTVVAAGAPPDGVTEVPADTLDALCGDRPPTLIKLDLEGHEPAALRGGRRVLASPELLALVIETFRPHNWQTESLGGMERLLAEHGFLPYLYRPADRSLEPITTHDGGGQNTIYVRDAAAVTDRARAAAPARPAV
jgi:FkbM family methyltransferase